MAKLKQRQTTSIVPQNKCGSISDKGGHNTGFPPHLLKNMKPYSADVESLIPNAIFTMRNALSSSECEAWIAYAEEDRGSKWEAVSHPATKYVAHRECNRLQRNDWNMSHRLFQRIESMVHEVETQLDIFDKASITPRKQTHDCADAGKLKYRPISCNPNLRLYKYTKGQWFGRHFDDSNKISITTSAPPEISCAIEAQTEITVLFYLSSCRGGATRFYLPHKTLKGKKGTLDDGTVAFNPDEGAVLLHVHGDHCLEHEAEPVLDGVKYVLRTDIVYGII